MNSQKEKVAFSESILAVTLMQLQFKNVKKSEKRKAGKTNEASNISAIMSFI